MVSGVGGLAAAGRCDPRGVQTAVSGAGRFGGVSTGMRRQAWRSEAAGADPVRIGSAFSAVPHRYGNAKAPQAAAHVSLRSSRSVSGFRPRRRFPRRSRRNTVSPSTSSDFGFLRCCSRFALAVFAWRLLSDARFQRLVAFLRRSAPTPCCFIWFCLCCFACFCSVSGLSVQFFAAMAQVSCRFGLLRSMVLSEKDVFPVRRSPVLNFAPRFVPYPRKNDLSPVFCGRHPRRGVVRCGLCDFRLPRAFKDPSGWRLRGIMALFEFALRGCSHCAVRFSRPRGILAVVRWLKLASNGRAEAPLPRRRGRVWLFRLFSSGGHGKESMPESIAENCMMRKADGMGKAFVFRRFRASRWDE